MPDYAQTPIRIRSYIGDYAARYPGAWKEYEGFREDRGKGLPDWPDWCWCPLSVSYAIVSGGGNNHVPMDRLADVSIMGALAAWRVCQGIYRFDSDLFAALWTTPMEDEIPTEALYRLPEWCVYVEAPEGYSYNGIPLFGWFVHLEYDPQADRPELRFLFDLDNTEVPLAMFALHMTEPTLEKNITSMFSIATQYAAEYGITYEIAPEEVEEQRKSLASVLSVMLYLCSAAADVSDMREKRIAPGNPLPVKTKRGIRTFPNQETTWLVGYRIGSALRQANTKAVGPGVGTHASPAPHMRRAHWHSFWLGPKSDPSKRKLSVRWLPPIPVGTGELVPTIRRVD